MLSDEVPVLLISKAAIGVAFLAFVATRSLTLLVQLVEELEYRASLMFPSFSWKNNLLSPFGRAMTAMDVPFLRPCGRVVGAEGGADVVAGWELREKSATNEAINGGSFSSTYFS